MSAGSVSINEPPGDSDNVPPLLPTKEEPEDFKWLLDLDDEDCFVPYEWDHTAKSAEFGFNGYTASLTDWHELLQITAPDSKCGLVNVRGSFPNSPDAIIARVQREDHTGGKGTWGFQIMPGGDFELGSVYGQGLVNSRWPYLRHSLETKRKENGSKEKGEEFYSGRYETLSFVKDGVVFQVVRLTPGKLKREKPQVAEEPPLDQQKPEGSIVGSVVNGELQETAERRRSSVVRPPAPPQEPTRRRKFCFKVGGRIRFSCACVLNEGPPNAYLYTIEAKEEEGWVSCACDQYSSQVDIQTFVDGKPATATKAPTASSTVLAETHCDISSTFEVPLEEFKAVVVVVTFSLRRSNKNQPSQPPSKVLPSSSVIANFLGVPAESDEATNRIWTLGWKPHDDRDSLELRAITNCVERILCVSSVPMSSAELAETETAIAEEEHVASTSIPGDDPALPNSDPGTLQDPQLTAGTATAGEEQTAPARIASVARDDAPVPTSEPGLLGSPVPVPEPNPAYRTLDGGFDRDLNHAVALVQNTVSAQVVDLKSTFWQIRFLVKAHDFLTFLLAKEQHERDDSWKFPSNTQLYREKIKAHIQRALVWITRAHTATHENLLVSASPFGSQSGQRHPPDNAISVEVYDVCYQAMAIWYVMKFLPEALTVDFKEKILRESLDILQNVSFTKDSIQEKDSSLKAALYQWLHVSCMYQIRERLTAETHEEGMDDAAVEELNKRRQEQSNNLQQLSERIFKLSGKARSLLSSDSYSAEDELVDRLALLAEEMIQKSQTLSIDIEFCAKHARNRILQRTKTSTFNPGMTKSKSGRTGTHSPWELACLNHHSLLAVALTFTEDVDVNGVKDDCFEFIASDYSFLPTWDASNRNMFRQWFDHDVSSILCSTLLDLKRKSFELEIPHISSTRRLRPANHTRGLSPQPPLDDGEHVEHRDDRLQELLEKQIQLQSNLIEMLRNPTTVSSDYDWTKVKTKRGDQYHPRAWVQSLDDTPEVFQLEQIKKVELRSEIKNYLRRKNGGKEVQPRTWTLENVSDQLPVEDLLYFSFFDISLSSASKGPFFVLRTGGRAVTLSYSYQQDGEAKDIFRDSPKLDSSETTFENRSLSLWSRFLDNCIEDYPYYNKLDQGAKDMLAKASTRKSILSDFHGGILNTLNDSLIDKNVRHRILLAQRCCPNLVEALIYMWHSDALDTIDSYLGPSSQFSNTKTSTWTTTITISHWEIEETTLNPRFRETRVNPLVISLGDKTDLGKGGLPLNNKIKFEESSSSLAITGDPQGIFWTCLLMSSQVDEDSMKSYVKSLAETSTLFIHQQSSGRCLTFLILLGHVCVHISREYERIVRVLMEKLSLGDKVLMMGFDWEQRDQAVYTLRRMILCLEALRVFDDRLSSSLSKIREARESMVREIAEYRQELGQHHEELGQAYKNIMEEFDKRHGSLSLSHVNIQQKIEQISRLRDGISSVTNVEDSRAAIKQNNNIRVLTYITIAYLPLGYVAALFSINDGFLPGHAGRGAYAWVTVLFVALTFIAAFSIEPVQAKWAGYQKARVEKNLKELAEMDQRNAVDLTRREEALKKAALESAALKEQVPSKPPSVNGSKVKILTVDRDVEKEAGSVGVVGSA